MTSVTGAGGAGGDGAGGKAVAITFDVDALSVWIGSYKATNVSMVQRGEFDVPATHRLLAMLASFDIPATFFIPGHTILAYPALVDAIAAGGHEIAHHGYVHERISELTPEREEEVLEIGTRIIEERSGARPVGYRSPSWEFTDHTPRLLERHGFRYDSSLMGSDFEPYWVRSGDRYAPDEPFQFGAPLPIVELPVSWILDDFPHFEYVRAVLPTMKAPSAVHEIWSGEFRYFRERVTTAGCFTLTLHPQCIGRGHRLLMLEELLGEIAASGIPFARLRDVADAWRDAQATIPQGSGS
jgi:peptidoglycan-N-acetylglucosamine deacetylase